MIEQGSPEWIAQRLGKVTASRIADALARTKTGWGASRANYMAELIAERLTGARYEGYVNAEMRWGTETEPQARDAYSFYAGVQVDLAEFVPHPKIERSGASPDGYVGADGLVELKCPNTSTHIDTLLDDYVPERYIKQMQWQMACTGRLWCDFVSFDPRMPEEMRIYIKRFPRDEAAIGQMEKDVELFLRELNTKLAALTSRYLEAAA